MHINSFVGGCRALLQGRRRKGQVGLSDPLELEEAQLDDIALFGTYGDLEWTATHQWGGPSGLGIPMNNQLPLPFPAPATPPSPSGLQIPRSDLYNQSNSSQRDDTSDSTLVDDLPPSER